MGTKWGQAWRAWGGTLLLGTCGCAGFWDEVTSREFEFHNLWTKPNPLVVLRDSTDLHRKGEALAQLKEPIANGGTREQQEMCLRILTSAALNEQSGQAEPMSRDPYCRLCAIHMLGEYHDPRAVKILEKAYLDPQPFTPEQNAIIRQQCLAALERTGSPDAVPVLVGTARQPGASAISGQVERQQILDEKLAAVRALGKFTHYRAVETLVDLLETEKDVAVRHCAHNSLKSATKKDLPPDARAWRELLARGPDAAPPPAPGALQRVTGMISRDDAKK